MKVKARSEKGFRRARAKSGRQRGLRARLTWRAMRWSLTLALVGYAGYRAFDLVLTASTLQVNRIRVYGNVRLSNGEVQARVRELQGANILTAALSHSRQALLRSPWVADVALRRVLPSTIEVYVSERRPFGLCRLGSQLFLLDRHGTVLDEFGPHYAEFDLPIIDGLVRGPRKGAAGIDATRVAFAARVVDALADRPTLAARVSQIDVRDPHDAVVLLDNDPSLLHLGEDRFRQRLESYVDIAAALKERFQDIDYVDLRFEQRVYLKPRGSAARTAVDPASARKIF